MGRKKRRKEEKEEEAEGSRGRGGGREEGKHLSKLWILAFGDCHLFLSEKMEKASLRSTSDTWAPVCEHSHSHKYLSQYRGYRGALGKQAAHWEAVNQTFANSKDVASALGCPLCLNKVVL